MQVISKNSFLQALTVDPGKLTALEIAIYCWLLLPSKLFIQDSYVQVNLSGYHTESISHQVGEYLGLQGFLFVQHLLGKFKFEHFRVGISFKNGGFGEVRGNMPIIFKLTMQFVKLSLVFISALG